MAGIRYVGHSTVWIELAGTRLLTDPILRGRIAHLRRVAANPPEPLPPVDAVLISHAHLDHLDVRSLRRLRPGPAVAPRGCRRHLVRGGRSPIVEMAPGGRHRVGGVDLTALRAEHDGRRHPLSRARDTLAYVVEGDGLRVFFAGDTDVFDGMGALAGQVDVALLPVTGWGSKVGPGHLTPESAASAAALLCPRVAIPIHWGTLASRGAPWLADPEQPARAFAERAATVAPSVEVRVLQPGETTEVLAAI